MLTYYPDNPVYPVDKCVYRKHIREMHWSKLSLPLMMSISTRMKYTGMSLRSNRGILTASFSVVTIKSAFAFFELFMKSMISCCRNLW